MTINLYIYCRHSKFYFLITNPCRKSKSVFSHCWENPRSSHIHFGDNPRETISNQTSKTSSGISNQPRRRPWGRIESAAIKSQKQPRETVKSPSNPEENLGRAKRSFWQDNVNNHTTTIDIVTKSNCSTSECKLCKIAQRITCEDPKMPIRPWTHLPIFGKRESPMSLGFPDCKLWKFQQTARRSRCTNFEAVGVTPPK